MSPPGPVRRLASRSKARSSPIRVGGPTRRISNQHPCPTLRAAHLRTLEILQQARRERIAHRTGPYLERRLAVAELEGQRVAIRRRPRLQLAAPEQTKHCPRPGVL